MARSSGGGGGGWWRRCRSDATHNRRASAMRRTGNSTPHSGTSSLSLSSGGGVPFLWRQPLTPPSPNRYHGLTVTGVFDPPLTPPPVLIGALPRLAPAVAPPLLSGIWRPPCRRRRTAQRLLVASKEERSGSVG